MPTTPEFDLPYPGPGDPNNVPVDLYALAARIETLLGDAAADLADAVPVGTVIEWDAPAAAPLPSKYLEQNGQAVSREDYPVLFELYGTAYGPGDGSSTFNLPNRKGRVGVGHDTGQTEFDTIGETGGAKTHTLTSAEMPQHDHTVNGLSAAPGDPSGDPSFYVQMSDGSGAQVFGVDTSSAGSGAAHNNLQPYFVTRFLVKAL